jgi:diaminopimelate epimerase
MDYTKIPINLKSGEQFTGYSLSVGNPHIIFFEDIELSILRTIGPQIEHHEFFPERCNVTFANVLDKENIKIKVWERGAGLTKACGTAACATAVASSKKNLTNKLVNIHFENGILTIEWKNDNHIYMSGPVSDIKEVNIEI